MRKLILVMVTVLALWCMLPAQTNGFLAGPSTTNAFVDGKPLLPGTVVLPGEDVTTGSGGTVTLAETGSQGGVVQLGSNASAQISANGASTGMDVTKGTAVVSGGMAVATPQAVFQPATGTNSEYVVNAGAQKSTMAVITGDVDTNTPTSTAGSNKATVVPAGEAVQVNDQEQVSNVDYKSVEKPAAAAAVTTTTAASTSH